MERVRKRLAEIAAKPDRAIDVAEVALLVAKEEYPELDVDQYVARLDHLADEARRIVPSDVGPTERIGCLNHFLFVEQHFTGNNDDYYDPRNSFLNEVLDRRTGIPISLSVVYTEVGRRLGIPLTGVGFPGHFLVKHVGEPEILIDPFFGGTITTDECAQRLKALDDEADFDPVFLEPASPRQTIVRMLRNLKQIYVSRDDHMRALSCVERVLLFVPDDAEEIRDRGILYLRLECWGTALRDLEWFLERAPEEDEATEAIREALPEVRREAERIH